LYRDYIALIECRAVGGMRIDAAYVRTRRRRSSVPAPASSSVCSAKASFRRRTKSFFRFFYQQFKSSVFFHCCIQASLASHRGGLGSSPGLVMWDLWWTKWRWGRFSPSISVSPANLHSTNCSTITLIYHLGLVQ
jgi:hypothetical protein